MKWKKYKCRRLSKKYFDNIIISNAFKNHPPKKEKYIRKRADFMKKKKLDPIIIDENYILADGYCAYLISDFFGYRGHKLKIYKAKGLDINNKNKENKNSSS